MAGKSWRPSTNKFGVGKSIRIQFSSAESHLQAECIEA